MKRYLLAAVHAPCTPMAYTYDAGGAHLVCRGIVFVSGFDPSRRSRDALPGDTN